MNEEEKRKYEAFQYWIQTNTERGVTTIPDNLCLFVVNLIKSLQKENEELKQDRKNNDQMIALSQQGALGYMQGYEDGKKSRRSAIANIVENQQYYIFDKQMEKCKKYIKNYKKRMNSYEQK